MSEVITFDHFHYANRLEEILSEAFSELQEVSFQPTRVDLTSTRYADLKLPAFLMSFDDPEIPKQSLGMRVDDEGDFMKVLLNLVGYLVLPWVPEENEHVPDLNPALLLSTAACNIAAKIFSKAGGLKAGIPKIVSIQLDDDTEDDIEYHVAEIRWQHEATVGVRADASDFAPTQLFGRFVPCPGLTVEPKLVYEELG